MKSFYVKLSKEWQDNFLLYASASIIVSTCLGAIAVFSIFQQGNTILQMFQLFPVIIVCNIVLATILTVQKPEAVLKALITSLSVTTLIMLINIIL